ncbi:MAG: hypothetical protein RIR11_3742 [Bacteroidota bacterium]
MHKIQKNDMGKFDEQLIPIKAEGLRSMLLSADKVYLLSKRVPDVSSFWEVHKKNGRLTVFGSVEPKEVLKFVLEQGETKIAVRYTKRFSLGMPKIIEFQNREDLETFVKYVEKQWFFNRSDITISPIKASIPYLFGMISPLIILAYIVYVEMKGGGYKVNIFLYFFIKLYEKIGFVASLLLSFIIIFFVYKKMLSVYKNPPVKTTLERRDN